ncbi:hypothetical protein JCM6882_001035 [Rhodosporidiobolus microsporus]
MPVLGSKKQRISGASASTASASASSSFPLTSLPKEVLARVVWFVGADGDDQGEPSPSLNHPLHADPLRPPAKDEDEDADSSSSSLASLSLVSKALLKLAQPLLFHSLILEEGKEVAGAAKVFKAKKGGEQESDGEGRSALRGVKELSVSLANPYSASPARSTLTSSLTSLLRLSPSLTSLTLTLGDPTAPSTNTVHHSLRSLFPSFPSPLTSLPHLRTFRLLASAEIWLHDLAPLLASWPALQTLEVVSLRGDCTTPLDPQAARPDKLAKLVVRESTLTGEMVAWLLDEQDALKWVEMPMPGADAGGRAWKAVEKVVEGVEVLKLWDRWAVKKAAAGKGGKKGAVAGKGKEEAEEDQEEEDDALSDIFEHPPSPLLALLGKCTSLRSLVLTTSVLPSAPTSESFELLLPHLTDLEELVMEDTPASGLRAAVMDALERRELQWLERVVSVGVKKKRAAKKEEDEGEGEEGAGVKKTKADKPFEKVCDKRGVEWVIEAA